VASIQKLVYLYMYLRLTHIQTLIVIKFCKAKWNWNAKPKSYRVFQNK
jgi:hypothetical protein